jgi:ZIP family zinc transporter
MGRQLSPAQTPAGSQKRRGPGAMSVGEIGTRRVSRLASWSTARRLSLLIAVGIGLLAEGLAIGLTPPAGSCLWRCC